MEGVPARDADDATGGAGGTGGARATACPDESVILAYAAGRLDPVDGGALREHAAGCSSCSDRLSSLPLWGTSQTTPESRAAPAPSRRVGRYELGLLLGSGGMGSVYEAHDTELDRRVAIKLLRERWASDSTSARLFREAQAMAKLAHPNVVVVYDVGIAEGQPFLTMELVEGTTLTKWLADEPRTWREVLDAFLPAGRGLAAAHATGIIHRDFKPDNVLVAKSGRVAVADFGVAARVTDGSSRGITGTPRYMAPEQMSAGAAVDARADVFGFSVALYEALYGALPFAGKNLAELRDAILAQALGAPTSAARARDVPAWVRAALLPGLAATPDARPETMDALLAALDPLPRARTRRRALLVTAAAALGIAVFGASVLAVRFEARHAAASLLAPSASATRVAVVVADERTARGDGAGEAIGAMMRGTLGAAPRVVVADEAYAAIAANAESDPAARAAAVGAARVVVVTLKDDRVDASIDDAVPGVAPLARASSAKSAGAGAGAGAGMDAARALAVSVACSFGATKEDAERYAATAVPRDAKAALLVGRALLADATHDEGAAAELFGEACAADTTSAAPCEERALALDVLGDRVAALDAARTAALRAGALPEARRKAIESLAHGLAGEHDAAIAGFRALSSARPDDRALAMALAHEEERAGQLEDAVATLDAVRARGVTAGSDPVVDSFEVEQVLAPLGDGKRALPITRSAIARAETLRDPWLAARARHDEATSLVLLGQRTDAESLEGPAREAFLAAHDVRGATWVTLALAMLRAEAGDLREARMELGEVVAQALPLGDLRLERAALGSLGVVYRRAGEPALAGTMLARAEGACRTAGDDRSLSGVRNEQCVLAVSSGDLRAGAGACDEALAIRRRLGDRAGIAASLEVLAAFESHEGDLAAAEGHAAESLTIALELGTRVDASRATLAGIVAGEGESRLGDAEALARTAVDEAVAAKDADTEALARAIVASTVAGQGRADDAKRAIVEADAALARTVTREARLHGALLVAAARLRNAPTAADKARVVKAMAEVEAEALRASWIAIALEARLLAGRARGSGEELFAVAADAEKLGLARTAKEARAAEAALP